MPAYQAGLGKRKTLWIFQEWDIFKNYSANQKNSHMMDSSRRTFIKSSALTIAAASMFGENLLASKKQEKFLGLQLYSVREDMKKDPAGTLKLVQQIGYQYVEHANYGNRKFYGYSATDFKKLLDDLGLKMRSGHTKMSKQDWDESKQDFSDSWKYTVEDAATVGQQYVISPFMDDDMRKTYDDFMHYMGIFNKSGELCKKSGMKFGYHNHAFEFDTSLNGVNIYDLIMKNTDPALVAQQLDMGNLYNGGAKAIDVVTKFPGRFELMHVKDEILAPSGGEEKYQSTVLGTGIVGTKQIVDIGVKSGGTSYFIVEQESFQNITPLQGVKQDYGIMKNWGF
jgi:sugar phosphate isomerase/epimerase